MKLHLTCSLAAVVALVATSCSSTTSDLTADDTDSGTGGANAGGANAGGANAGGANAGRANTGGGGGSSGNGGSAGKGGATGDGGTGAWTNITSNLKFIATTCGNLGFIVAKPDEDKLLLGLAAVSMYESVDGGASWEPLGKLANRPNTLLIDPVTPTTLWVSGCYGQGVYKSTDDAVTMVAMGNVSHNDSMSVDFTDPERKTMIAGGHEAGQTVFKTSDNGATWTNIGTSLPAGTSFSSWVHIVDTQTYFVSTNGWGGGTKALFKTTDGGSSFTSAGSEAPQGYPLVASDGAIYWPMDGGLVKSTDKGATWTTVGTSAGLAAVRPTELPDKRIASAGKDKQIKVSADGGNTWTTIAGPVPFSDAIGGITYSKHRKFFVAYYGNCWNNLPDNTIWKMSWDYETN